MADTGQGASLTLATTSFVGLVKSLTLPDVTIDKIDDTDLSTEDFKTYISTDLAEPGEISAEVVFDQSAISPLTYTSGTNTLTVFGVAQTVTVTFPIVTPTNTTAATLAGTGFITGVKMPDLKTGELQMATYTVAFDGKTGPTFTEESA